MSFTAILYMKILIFLFVCVMKYGDRLQHTAVRSEKLEDPLQWQPNVAFTQKPLLLPDMVSCIQDYIFTLRFKLRSSFCCILHCMDLI